MRLKLGLRESGYVAGVTMVIGLIWANHGVVADVLNSGPPPLVGQSVVAELTTQVQQLTNSVGGLTSRVEQLQQRANDEDRQHLIDQRSALVRQFGESPTNPSLRAVIQDLDQRILKLTPTRPPFSREVK